MSEPNPSETRCNNLEESIKRIDNIINRKELFKLKFPPDFELLFQTYFKNQFYTHTKMVTIIGLFVFVAFSLIERLIEKNSNPNILFFEFDFWGNIIAISLMTLIMRGFDSVRHIYFYGTTILLVLLLISVAKITTHELDLFYFIIVFLMQVYSFVFLRTRISFSLSSVFTLFLMFMLSYALTDLLIKKDDPIFLMIFVAVSTLALFVEYLIEYYVRYNYLKAQSFIFQAEYMGAINYELKLKSETDGLTKLYNKAYFLKALKKEWYRCKRKQNPIGLLFIDIDFFKEYNDSLGHIEGDILLNKITKILTHYSKRTYDVAARFGGDEFVILYPETPEAELRTIAQKIKTDIKMLNIIHENSPIEKRVTISMGGVSFQADPKEDEHSENFLLRTADRLLYEAKKKGRNCIVIKNLNKEKI